MLSLDFHIKMFGLAFKAFMFSFQVTTNMYQLEIFPREKKFVKVPPVQLASFRTTFSSLDHRWENLTRFLNHMIQIPSAKQDSALFTAVWVDFVQPEAVVLIIRPLTAKPSLVTAKTQLLTGRPSKVVSIVLLFL